MSDIFIQLHITCFSTDTTVYFVLVFYTLQYVLSEMMEILPHCSINLLKPTGHVMHRQFNIQQL